jgi:hypothetical protein
MSAQIRSFDETLSRAIAEGRQARQERLDRLQAMPTAEIAQLTPEELASIGVDGLVALASERREFSGMVPKPGYRPAAGPPGARQLLPPRPVSMAIAIAASLLLLGLLIDLARPMASHWVDPGARPVSTETWPLCRRLDAWADSCIYVTESPTLTPDRAATLLRLPVEQLLSVNPQLGRADEARLPVGSVIAVWRGRMKLEGPLQ